MPTAKDFADSVRRPLKVAENAMLANNDEFAAAAAIRAAQQAVAIAWMNMHDPLRKSKLDNIVEEISKLASVQEKARVETAVQEIVDREEAFEHPEESVNDGGLCVDEPECEGAGTKHAREHDEGCPAHNALKMKYYSERLWDLQP